MSVEITEVTRGEREKWDSYVDHAPNATPFHQYTVLELFADHADADLHLLVGYKGEEPVGLLSLFETERGPFTELRSPPLNTELMHLGPLQVDSEEMKQRTVEKNRRRFVNGCWNWIKTAVEPDLVEICCDDRYTDVRPYLWNDFEAIPKYTYIIALAPGVEALFSRLSKETRRKIRNANEDTYEIVEGDTEDVRTITRQVQARHAEQGRSYGLTPDFMAEFHARVPDEQVHSYCLYRDGELISGLFALEFGDTMYVWIGGAKTDSRLPVNELLYWHVIERAVANELDRVDLTTAMVPSLADYKAKFGPEPKPLFDVRWQSRAWQISKVGSKLVPEKGRNAVKSLLS